MAVSIQGLELVACIICHTCESFVEIDVSMV